MRFLMIAALCLVAAGCKDSGGNPAPVSTLHEESCMDQEDGDHDGPVDCADPDCDGRACGDLACTIARTCAGGECQGGTPRSCETPPGDCITSAESCSEELGGCVYVVHAGERCDGGTCQSDGTCADVTTETDCSNGIDDDLNGLVDCADPDCAGVSCDDHDACTTGEVCDATSQQCANGAPLSCGPSGSECLAPAQCSPATGCEATPRPRDTPCDGGFCDEEGSCVPPFPYSPSNFDPLAVTTTMRTGSYVLDCGDSTFDSASLTFDNWCGLPTPTVTLATQGTGPEAAVISLTNLTILPGSRLHLRGTRPVIIAVYGDATIDGRLDAAAEQSTSGPGAHACSTRNDGQATTWIYSSIEVVASGGSGGSFGTPGACGGIGRGNNGSHGTFCSPPADTAWFALSPLVGGCGGGEGGGGRADAGVTPTTAFGGGAGGGLQLSVAGTLTVHGSIDAVGAGGGGATVATGGGGGGGAGGGVLLEADAIVLSGSSVISVTGGAGGEAAGLSPGSTGLAGEDGHHATLGAAMGGTSGDCPGMPGGNGGFPGFPPQSPMSPPGCSYSASLGGGGGGGGGMGFIRLNARTGCFVSVGAGLWGVVTSSGPNCPK